MIKICTDKQATRALYEEVFNDSREFVDYYYEDKCLDNTIFVSVENEKIVSMLHLNPYYMNICGHTEKVYYVVAVATAEPERHKGHMTRLFDAAFDYMRREHIPFCFLLPADERIYSWLGFETISEFMTTSVTDYSKIQQSYDIYCLHDDNYIRRAEKEASIEASCKEDSLPESPVIMAKIIDLDKMSAIAGISFANEADALAWIRAHRIYICEEV